MTSLGKSLAFQPAEVDELLDLSFGSPRIFPVLAMLYPGLDLSKAFHEDHIFPRSRFTRSRLLSAGIAPDLVDQYIDKVNRLPNLQLLPGIQNMEKQAKLPAEWLAGASFPSEEFRQHYVHEHDIHNAGDLSGFLDFYASRSDRMSQRLRTALGMAGDHEVTTGALTAGAE